MAVFKRHLNVLRLMIALGFFTNIAASANPLLFKGSMLLTHASLAPQSSSLPQYLPCADVLNFAFAFAFGAGAGEILEAGVAVDPKTTGLVGRP